MPCPAAGGHRALVTHPPDALTQLVRWFPAIAANGSHLRNGSADTARRAGQRAGSGWHPAVRPAPAPTPGGPGAPSTPRLWGPGHRAEPGRTSPVPHGGQGGHLPTLATGHPQEPALGCAQGNKGPWPRPSGQGHSGTAGGTRRWEGAVPGHHRRQSSREASQPHAAREATRTCWILDQFSSTDRPFTAPVMARKHPRKHGANPPCKRGDGAQC